MCGLFIKRLINLTEEKIKENPFFFFIHSFSYRSIRSRFQISNSYLYLSQENPLNILVYRLQSVLGGVRLKILQTKLHKSEGDTLHSNLSVSRLTGSPFIVYSFGYTVNIMPLNIQ